MQQRIYKLDTIKAIAMISVIFFHCFVDSNKLHLSSHLNSLLIPCTLGCSMFLFAFTSGYTMRPRHWNWNSIIKLIIIGIFFNVLINYVHTLSFAEFYVAPVIWFLCVLITCKIILPYFKNPSVALTVSILISWLSFLYPSCLNFNPANRFLGLLPFFALGFWVANDAKAEKIKAYIMGDRHRIFYVILSPILILGLLYLFHHSYGYIILRSLQNAQHFINASPKYGCLRVISHIAITFCCLVWFKAIPSRETWFSKYGQRTLPVYLLHIIPIFVISNILKIFQCDWSFGRFLIYGIAFIIDLCLFHHVFNDAMIKIMKR